MTSVSSTNIMSTLGAGSGVDTQSLAQNLANAEIQPRKELVNTKISKAEASISGLGYIRAALSELKTAFGKLDDAADFASITASTTQPGALGITATSSAQAGSFSLEVSQLARAQRSASNAFAARDTPLNRSADASGTYPSTPAPFDLALSVNGASATKIQVLTDTPAGVVSAINGAQLGIQAQLLQTGDAQAPYVIVLTGESGQAKNFSIGFDSADTSIAKGQLRFSNTLQSAADAQLKINGLSVSRSSNKISDLIEGVSLDLYTTTSAPARVDLQRETSAIKDNFRNLVSAYNNLESTFKELGDPKSTIETVGGVFSSDSILQTIRAQVRHFITDEASTKGASVRAARHAGLSFDRDGQLTLDEARLEQALQLHFDETVQVFSAGSNNKSVYSDAPAGVAGDAVVKLDKLLRSTGLLSTRTQNANQKISAYKADLTNLDEQMSRLLARYTQQFSIMDSIVGQSTSLRTSLKSTFEGMMASSKN